MAESKAAQLANNEKTQGEQKKIEFVREGEKIIIPVHLSWKEVLTWVTRMKEEDEEDVRVSETMDAFPLDGAHALMVALAQTYGWTDLVPTPTFWGPKPPDMISVEFEPGKTKQVAWGRVQIPGVEGWISPGLDKKDGRTVFSLTGVVKKKHLAEIKRLADRIRVVLHEGSLYRGKAIRVSFEPEGENFDPSRAPKFIDTATVREEELIFPQETMNLVNTALFIPIENTAVCRAHRIPLKRGILLEGPFGTGKTLTAFVAAKKCVANGWTFIYIDKVADLEAALLFAKQYQPAVVFAEDIDRVTSGPRDEKVDAVLNTIDGVVLKGTEIMVVLTTNNIEAISQAMLRPGRLDAVVSVLPPDGDAAQKLIRLYARGLLPDSEPLDKVGALMAGQIPAIIREVVERSKLTAIGRVKVGENIALTQGDLEVAALSMIRHQELLKPRPEDKRSDVEKAADALGGHLVQMGAGKPNGAGHAPTVPFGTTTVPGQHAASPAGQG